MRPFAKAPVLASVIVFIGLALIFNALAGWLYGYTVKSSTRRSPAARGSATSTCRRTNRARSLVSLCVLALVYAFFRFTPLGLAMRAAAQNPVSSRLVGIRVGWMLALGWGLAAAIGAIAGMMAAPIVYLDPNMMAGILLYAFAGAVLGGIDNPWGAVFGGFVVGVLENLVGAYLSAPRLSSRSRSSSSSAFSSGARPGCSGGDSWRGSERCPIASGSPPLVVVTLAVLRLSRLPFRLWRRGYHLYQGSQVLILCDRADRPQSADRIQRPDFARPWRLLRDWRLWRRDPDSEVRRALLGGDPDRERSSVSARASCSAFRRCGSAASISRSRPSRSPSRPRRSSATRASTPGPGVRRACQLAKPHAAVRPALNADQWIYLLCLVWAAALFWAARNLAAGRIGRALIAIRDQPIAAETMGVNAALYKTTCFGVSALYAGVAGGLSAIAVGFVSPDSFGLSLSLSFLVGIVVGGLASIGGVVFGALFIEFVPNYADQLSVNFGESAKALPGAIYGCC